MPMKKNNGFTLVELMVVVVIVAIFAAIAIPSYQAYIRRSNIAAAKQEMLRLADQLAQYKSKAFSYHGFTPDYLYGLTTSTMTSLSFPTTTGSTTRYTITLADISVSGSPVTLLSTSTGLGQAWAIKAIPVSTNYDALLLTSTGIKCAVTYTSSSDLTTVDAYTGCGSNTKAW